MIRLLSTSTLGVSRVERYDARGGVPGGTRMAETLADMIRERASDRGDAPAITYLDSTITYAQLDARSNQVAHALRAAGIGHGDRVAVLDKNVPEFFELLLGAAKLGAVLAAVNWRLAPLEVAQILNYAGARGLLAAEE